MRKITFLLFLLCSVLVYGQSLPVDFEDGTSVPAFGFGANFGFGNVMNPDPTAPNTSTRVLEINKPDNAEWFAGLGFQTTGSALVDFSLSTEITFKIWTPKPNLPVRVRVQADLGINNEAYNVDIVVATPNAWQEITVDFGSIPGVDGDEQFQELVIFPDYDPACDGAACTTLGAGNGAIHFLDDVAQTLPMVDPMTDATLSDLTVDGNTVAGFAPNVLTYDIELPNGTMMAPTVAGVATQAGMGASDVSVTQAPGIPGSATVDVTAPNGTDMQTYTVNFTEAAALPPAAPTPTEANAISIISDVYANVNTPQVDVFGGTLTNLDLNSDTNEEARLLNGGSGFQFNYFPGNAFLDVTDAAFLHLDVYCDNLADNDILRIRLLDNDPGANGANIARYEFSAAESGTWVSIDLEIPSGGNLNDFGDIDSAGAPVDLSTLALIQINTLDLGSTLASKDVYLSNIYFYGGTLSTPDIETSEFRVFPNPTNNVWNLTSTNTINSVLVYDILGKQVLSVNPNSNEATIVSSSLRTGVYFARVEGTNGSRTIKLVRE